MSFQESFSLVVDYLSESNLFIFVCIWIAYQLFKSAYNLFFHPLRYIPGPKLAAATYFPEFYYDVVKFGRYTSRIKEMHMKYGMMFFVVSSNI